MSEQKHDGGPAFPELSKLYQNQYSGERSSYLHYKAETSGGMSLRDWFAGQALPQVIARELGPNGRFQHLCDPSVLQIASDAYAIADALLLARGESQ